MTRRGRRSERSGVRRRTRSRRPLGLAIAASLVVATAAVLVFGWIPRPWEGPAPSAPAGSRVTSARRFDLPTPRAYLEAAGAANAGADSRTMLAIADEGLARFPGDPLLSLARAAALNNLSFRTEVHRGRGVPGLATSLERVKLAQESIATYEAVARRLPSAAEPIAERGLVLITWGMPQDGLSDLRRAYGMGDRRPEILNAIAVVSSNELSP